MLRKLLKRLTGGPAADWYYERSATDYSGLVDRDPGFGSVASYIGLDLVSGRRRVVVVEYFYIPPRVIDGELEASEGFNNKRYHYFDSKTLDFELKQARERIARRFTRAAELKRGWAEVDAALEILETE